MCNLSVQQWLETDIYSMAIKQDPRNLLKKIVPLVSSITPNLKMLEYGDQILRPNVDPAKEYWIGKGFDHTPVDLNGKRGAVVKDLSFLMTLQIGVIYLMLYII